MIFNAFFCIKNLGVIDRIYCNRNIIALWKAGLISAMDVTYVSVTTGEMVCCEVVTNSYKESDIQGKEYCGEILQTEIEYVRA